MIVKVTNNDRRDHKIPLSIGMIRFPKGETVQIAAELTQRDFRVFAFHRLLRLQIDNQAKSEGLPKIKILGWGKKAKQLSQRSISSRAVGKTRELIPSGKESHPIDPENPGVFNGEKTSEVQGMAKEIGKSSSGESGGSQKRGFLDSLKKSQAEAASKKSDGGFTKSGGALGGK